MKKVVKIFLINPENKILLQLRDNKPAIPYPGFWGLLGGGIDKNEEPEQAIKREIKEEINSEIKNLKPIGELNFQNTEHLYYFKGEISEPEDELNKRLTEGQRVQFFSYDEIKNLKLTPMSKQFIEENKERIFG